MCFDQCVATVTHSSKTNIFILGFDECVGGVPLVFGGEPLVFGGASLVFGGVPLVFGGVPLVFGGVAIISLNVFKPMCCTNTIIPHA